MVVSLNISIKVQNGQLITENGQQLETADGQIIQHSVSDGSVIKRIQQGGGEQAWRWSMDTPLVAVRRPPQAIG